MTDKRTLCAAGLGMFLVCVAVTVVMRSGGGTHKKPPFKALPDDNPEVAQSHNSPAGSDPIRADVIAFCGACHAMPKSSSFPRGEWPKEVRRGFDFYLESGRNDLKVPSFHSVVEYFRSQAPDKLVIPKLNAERSRSPIAFRIEPIQTSEMSQIPAVAFVGWLRLDPALPGAAYYCDMFSGDAGRISFQSGRFVHERLAKLNNPCHVESADLDGDSRSELVIADLGSFQPEDHTQGSVVRLFQKTDGGDWQAEVLLDGVGRIADVRPADFDADGDTDLVVAEFGWQRTGRILLLRNQTVPGTPLRFDPELLDPRHGTIHVPVADLNGDGLPDFVALISQEHEVVEAFVNEGHGVFQKKRIFAADDPAFGSSGIELTDLDGDGDLDVLYTNGDSMDSHQAKPYHSIHWLENRGTFPYTVHRIATFPGASRAVAADVDADGLTDVIATAWLPDHVARQFDAIQHDSIIWLRQHRRGQFQRYQIEAANFQHMCATPVDIDGDGKLDFITAGFAGIRSQPGPPLTILWNRGSASTSGLGIDDR